MSQAGIINVIENNPEIPTQFDADTGMAVAIANVINIVGSGSTTTSATGNTITINSSGISGPNPTTDNAIATWNGTTGTALNNTSAIISTAGVYTNTTQPASSWFLFNALSNVTGDGTTYGPIIFDQECYDQASNYDSGTGIFTCPVAGIYQVNLNVCFEGLGLAHMVAIVIINVTSANGSVNVAMTLNPYAIQQGTNASVISLNGSFRMQAGGTIYPTVQVQGGTKTVGLLGAPIGATFTNFSVTKIA